MRARMTWSTAWILAFAATLGGPAYADSFGAIAYSRSTGAAGWSFDYTSRIAAEAEALKRCRAGAKDCEIAVWFKNNCGAVAASPDSTYAWSWADDRISAEARAVRDCAKNGVKDCKVVVWACNGSRGGGTDFNGCMANLSVRCAAQCGGHQQPCHGQCTGGGAALCR